MEISSVIVSSKMLSNDPLKYPMISIHENLFSFVLCSSIILLLLVRILGNCNEWLGIIKTFIQMNVFIWMFLCLLLAFLITLDRCRLVMFDALSFYICKRLLSWDKVYCLSLTFFKSLNEEDLIEIYKLTC